MKNKICLAERNYASKWTGLDVNMTQIGEVVRNDGTIESVFAVRDTELTRTELQHMNCGFQVGMRRGKAVGFFSGVAIASFITAIAIWIMGSHEEKKKEEKKEEKGE